MENKKEERKWFKSPLVSFIAILIATLATLIITSHPPQYYHDLNGLGEGFILLIFIKSLGIISVILGITFLSSKANKVISIFLIVIGFLYLSQAVIVLKMRNNIEKILYPKDFAEQTRRYQEINNQTTNFISMGFASAFAKPVTINDIEKNIVYIKNEHGVFILLITNAEQIGLLQNSNSFINKPVTFEMDMDYLSKNGGVSSISETKEGAILISRNASKELKKQYED